MNPRSIGWCWLAGFFDGEGCICLNTHALSWYVAIGQADKVVLENIQIFLARQGIEAKIYDRKYTDLHYQNTYGKKPVYVMWVSRRRSNLTPFLNAILPYLQTNKKEQVQDALRMMRIFPERTARQRFSSRVPESKWPRQRQARGG